MAKSNNKNDKFYEVLVDNKVYMRFKSLKSALEYKKDVMFLDGELEQNILIKPYVLNRKGEIQYLQI